MNWQLPSDEQIEKERADIARWRAEAQPLTDKELADLEEDWMRPGIHQYSGMGANMVRRMLATIKARA
jgi:hypothetical protein